MFQNIRSKAKDFFQNYEKADKPSHQILGGKLIDIGRICSVDCREGYGGTACNPARTSTRASLSPVNPSLDRQYHALQQPYPNPKGPKHAWKQPLCPKNPSTMTVIERQMPLGVREVGRVKTCAGARAPTSPRDPTSLWHKPSDDSQAREMQLHPPHVNGCVWMDLWPTLKKQKKGTHVHPTTMVHGMEGLSLGQPRR